MAKERGKSVIKTTMTKSIIPGERAYIDLIGPVSASLGGASYWMQVVNDAACIGFCYFLKNKSLIGEVTKSINQVKTHSHEVKIICCNNASENTKHIQATALQGWTLLVHSHIF